MSPRRWVVTVLLALALAPGAATVKARATETPAASSDGAVTLPISAANSLLTFTIRRPGETIDGTAHEFTGDVTFDPADLPAGGAVVLRVAAVSLETGNRLRDRKMRNSHLEVERFPDIVFRSTSIEVGGTRDRSAPGSPASGAPCPPFGAGDRRVLVEGVLGLHGAERSLMVPAAIRYDGGALTAEGCVNLTYTDYGIPIPRFLWLVMDDDIQVRFRIVAGAVAH